MRIDSHHHIWDLSVRDQEWIAGEAMQPIRRNFSISDLERVSAASRIDRTILVQTVTDYSETPELDPYGVSGHVSFALLEELMATASIVGRA